MNALEVRHRGRGLTSGSDKAPRSFRTASSSKEMEEMSSGGFMWRATNMEVACLLAASQRSQQDLNWLRSSIVTPNRAWEVT